MESKTLDCFKISSSGGRRQRHRLRHVARFNDEHEKLEKILFLTAISIFLYPVRPLESMWEAWVGFSTRSLVAKIRDRGIWIHDAAWLKHSGGGGISPPKNAVRLGLLVWSVGWHAWWQVFGRSIRYVHTGQPERKRPIIKRPGEEGKGFWACEELLGWELEEY